MKNLVRKFVSLFTNKKPAHHHYYVESGMTNECDFGCKIVKCQDRACGNKIVSHSRIYGCPLG